MSTGMIKYDAMCHAVAECRRVDEAKDLRDKAKAIEVYARQAQNYEIERQAGEVRLRAERQAGVLLEELADSGQRAKVGYNGGVHRGAKKGMYRENTTLNTLGVTRVQSSTWQKLARVPDVEFEGILKQPGPRPTATGILNRNKPVAQGHLDATALWVHGVIDEFERKGILKMNPSKVFGDMPDFQQERIRRICPCLIEWLRGME